MAAPLGRMRNVFSIIIPTRNRAELVRRAVASAACQAGASSEILVVDDGSCEEERERLMLLEGTHAGVKVVTQEHAGAAMARNRGAAVAAGDILVFLDSDDELLPAAVAHFASAFGDGVGAVCSSAVAVDGEGRQVATIRPRMLGPAYENERGLFLAGSFAVRKCVFEALGGFAAQCRSSQHTEFALRLMPYLKKQGLGLSVLEGPTVRVRTHDRPHLRGNLDNLLAGALYIIEHHHQQLSKSPKHFSDWCTIAAVYAAKLRQFGLARRLLWRSLRSRPGKLVNYARLTLTLAPPVARRVWRPETIR